MAFRVRRITSALLLLCSSVLLVSCGSGGDSGGSGPSAPSAFASAASGGFLQTAGSTIRPRWTNDQLQTFLPTGRGTFRFPAPYHTDAMRVTGPEDCGGQDCVFSVGYSYWRNMNNHVDSNQMLIFLSTDRVRGGQGPTLFSYDKTTDQISSLGPLFDSRNPLSWSGAGGWYFSAKLPTKLYLNDGPRMVRFDVLTKESEVVYDLTSEYGADRQVWQMSSSDDDQMHAATLKVASSGEDLGCLIFAESSKAFRFFPKVGQFDECQIDKSGRYLMIFEQLDGLNDMDNLIIDLYTGVEQRLLNVAGVGSVGHHDLGYGYVVGGDGYNALPNAFLTWTFGASLSRGPADHRSYDWSMMQIDHVSHTNAKAGIPMSRQYACGSGADRVMSAQNEILCFRLDGSMEELVVAPVMTNLDASGGGNEDYNKMPKGNLDVTGQYFIWTSNLGGGRLDAFIVKVPGQLLSGS
jgi:hypothetical protein